MPRNPKKPTGDESKQGKHISRKMVRLDDDIHALFSLLAIDENRPMTMEIRPLLIEYLQEKKYLPITDAMVRRLKEIGLWSTSVEIKLKERGFWPPKPTKE